MFQSYMRKLTVVRSSVLTAGESDESSSCTKDAQIFQVFETLEVLLLFSGSVLTPTMREEIEICVGQGMYVRLFIFWHVFYLSDCPLFRILRHECLSRMISFCLHCLYTLFKLLLLIINYLPLSVSHVCYYYPFILVLFLLQYFFRPIFHLLSSFLLFSSLLIGLATLCKGVTAPQHADRRMHRVICEKLRENPCIQG